MSTPALEMQSVRGSMTPLATYVPIRQRSSRTTSGGLELWREVTNPCVSKPLSLNLTLTFGYLSLNSLMRSLAIVSPVSNETPNALMSPDASIVACEAGALSEAPSDAPSLAGAVLSVLVLAGG